MNLTQERKLRIRQKVEPLLAALDPQLKLVEILVESTRQLLRGQVSLAAYRKDRPFKHTVIMTPFENTSRSPRFAS